MATTPDPRLEYSSPLPPYRRPPPTFATLPVELHLLVTQYLIYPDALSLKHTNQYFFDLVNTGINLKIEWLIERRRLHLDCPHDRKCELGSDMRFCRGSVRLLMKRRREHTECDTRPNGRGCLVFGTKVCTFRKERKGILGRMSTWVGNVTENQDWRWRVAMLVSTVVVALAGLMLAFLLRGGYGMQFLR